MANTSRKRPAPAAPTTNNGQSTNNVNLPSGIDTLLAKYAKHLKPGQTISIQLIKGPISSSVDPIAARKAATKAAHALASTNNNSGVSSGNDTDNDTTIQPATVGKGINAPLNFPRLAKFSETVTPPDFIKGRLKDGRMYEEEVPLAKDESDEEESTAYKPMNMAEDGTDLPESSTNKNKKKKRRWRRHDVRPRRWVLQEKAEFFDRIRKRKQRGSAGTGGDDDDEQGISNQYHGVVESNTSKYVILSVAPPTTTNATSLNNPSTTKLATEQISIQPIYGQHTFSQPYKFASLTMEEAESAIEQQRNVVTRYMMHGKLASANTSNNAESRAALSSGVASVGVGRGSWALNRPIGPAPKAMSRARLLGKLGGGGGGLDEDDDDVMGDVRYSSSKGSGRARKELLTTLGDGVTADDDGVLGGANDAEFGGRQRFGRVNMKTDDDEHKKKKAGKDDSGKTSTGFEAGAMEEGFYQRDVAAEYEALDYDANEQFDDDDVNVGEDEMMDDGGGYGGDFHDSGDDMLESDDEGASDDDGFKGMATSSGLKAMLAKARGESPVTASSAAAAAADNASSSMLSQDILDATVKNVTDANKSDEDKGIDSAKKIAEDQEKKSEKDKPSPSAAEKAAALGIEKDKDGKRLITLEAVRREIWLNNGAITSKRLTKKFDVTKKNPERQALFKTIVMELCTIKKDADGNKLVLKQHYAKV